MEILITGGTIMDGDSVRMRM